MFRVFAPDKKELTHYNDSYKASTRLDRFYISRLGKDNIVNVEHVPVIQTDHKAVFVWK